MKILISNDDGWGAKGILTLARLMRELGDVVVVAPDGPRSGQSSAITVLHPVHLRHLEECDAPAEGNLGSLTVYTCSGTPSDCVKMYFSVISPDCPPDLVCSGINHGDNGTINVIYSGTMGAAFVGAEHGLRSIGWSICDHNPDADFSAFAEYIVPLTKQLLELPHKPGLCWNINAPVGPLKGYRFTRQGRGYWDKEWALYHDPSNRPFYLITGEYVSVEPDSATDHDHYANDHGYISITPTTVDMTDYEVLNKLA